jgi:AraC family transcriptional regulator
MHPMGSYARLNQEEYGSRSQESWSEHERAPVLAAKKNVDAAGSPNDRSGLADRTVGTQCLPTKPATTDRILSVEQPHPVGWDRNARSQDSTHEGFSAEDLLDDVRRAMERNPNATRAAVSQLVTFLTPPDAVQPANARGGLAPWQKRKVDRYLRENLDRTVRLNAVAEQVALSVSYFSRAFKESFGTTPHTHILRLRLELAQKLMLTTEDPLSQIAFACGLADQAHLSKLFRRLVGETPNAWRRRHMTDAQADARSRRSARSQFVSPASRSSGIAASL